MHKSLLQGEGLAMPVYSGEDGVVCGVRGIDAAGVPQGTEDPHRYLCLSNDTTQYALPELLGIGALALEPP